MKRHVSNKQLVIGAFLATSALASPAVANPLYRNWDENGVDLVVGDYEFEFTEATIGSGRAALPLIRVNNSSDEFSQWDRIRLRSSGVSEYRVTLPDGSDDVFEGNPFSGALTSTKQNGATLVYNLSSDEFEYESALGDTIRFSTTLTAGGYYPSEYVQLGVHITDFAYDVSGTGSAQQWRLTKISNNFGYSVNFHYQSNTTGTAGWLTRASATFSRDTTAVSTVNYAYPVTGTVDVTDPAGKIWEFTATSLKRPTDSSPEFSISQTGGIVTAVTNDGVTTSYDRVVSGSTVTLTRTDPHEHATVITSDLATDRIKSIEDPLSRTTGFDYDSYGRLTKVTMPEGNAVQYTLDDRGNITQTSLVPKPGSGGSTLTWTATFSSTCDDDAPRICNRASAIEDPKGNVTNFTYGPVGGVLTSVTRPPVNGVQPKTTYSYGNYLVLTGISECQTASLGNCVGTSDEVKTTIAYDAYANPLTVSEGNGSGTLTATSTMTYDNSGNLLTVDGPLPGTADTTRYRYDPARRLAGITSPAPGDGQPDRAVRNTYDSAGRLTKREFGTVASQSDSDWAAFTSHEAVDIALDTNGRVETRKLSAGGTDYALTQTDYDSNGRVRCTAVRMNPAVYGSLPSLACNQSTGGADQITRINYDAAGNPKEKLVGVGTTAAATERSITYTGNGKVETLTDANNNTTTYSYDEYDRLKKITYPDGTHEDLTPDANGNVTSRDTRAGQSIDYSYDALNRLIHTGGALPDQDYTYDNLGRMLTATFSTGGQGITNTWDALGRLTSTSSNMGGTARALSYQYDSSGRRTKFTYPDGFYLNYDYLVTGEVSKIRENGATSGLGVLATYTYDNLGNRTRLTLGNGVVTNYGFDAVSRLSSLTHDLSGTTNDQTKTFAYNPASQITSETRSNDAYAWNGAVNINRGYTSNNLNQYTAAGTTSFTYDANGNLTSDGTNSFAYDADNELTTATVAGITAHFTYDPAGRLAQMTGTDVSDRTFLYDGLHTVAEYSSGGAIRARYVFGPGADEPLLQYGTDGVRTWYTADERGSIVGDSNDAGTVTSINTYDEYGIPGSTNSGRFQYTGQMWISELGMYFYKSRAYSPTLGRFLQTDPIGYADNANDYAYTGNDPVNLVDPIGLADAIPSGPILGGGRAECALIGCVPATTTYGNGTITITALSSAPAPTDFSDYPEYNLWSSQMDVHLVPRLSPGGEGERSGGSKQSQVVPCPTGSLAKFRNGAKETAKWTSLASAGLELAGAAPEPATPILEGAGIVAKGLSWSATSVEIGSDLYFWQQTGNWHVLAADAAEFAFGESVGRMGTFVRSANRFSSAARAAGDSTAGKFAEKAVNAAGAATALTWPGTCG